MQRAPTTEDCNRREGAAKGILRENLSDILNRLRL
jgi:hypothetical protein